MRLFFSIAEAEGNVIRDGKTKIYGNRGKNTRYPTGRQVVVRKTDKWMLGLI